MVCLECDRDNEKVLAHQRLLRHGNNILTVCFIVTAIRCILRTLYYGDGYNLQERFSFICNSSYLDTPSHTFASVVEFHGYYVSERRFRGWKEVRCIWKLADCATYAEESIRNTPVRCLSTVVVSLTGSWKSDGAWDIWWYWQGKWISQLMSGISAWSWIRIEIRHYFYHFLVKEHEKQRTLFISFFPRQLVYCTCEDTVFVYF